MEVSSVLGTDAEFITSNTITLKPEEIFEAPLVDNAIWKFRPKKVAERENFKTKEESS